MLKVHITRREVLTGAAATTAAAVLPALPVAVDFGVCEVCGDALRPGSCADLNQLMTHAMVELFPRFCREAQAYLLEKEALRRKYSFKLLDMQREREAFMAKFIGEAE